LRLPSRPTWRTHRATRDEPLNFCGQVGERPSATPLPLDCQRPTLSAVSTLWTPSGEHEVPRPGPRPGGGGGEPPPGGGRPPSGSGGGRSGAGGAPEPGDEEELSEEELREVAQQLAAAPPEDVIANHCYGLFELAALHLSQRPPQLPQASLAIDAMGCLVEGLGNRLGPHAPALADGLNQLRLAFVRISDAGAVSD
jgi:hypothetical protein